jgi:glycosyltransferase involved in cell wall biosynthesis
VKLSNNICKRRELSMSIPMVSVIIPCYNHGNYIQDTIDSVEASTYANHEIIIVNDGSTDAFTIEKMDELMQCGYHIINQCNQGLASTRNNGINTALGEYIMPVDADNKIRPTYIEKAVNILNTHPEIGVIYGKSAYFGEITTGCFSGELFDPVKLYRENYIDALAVFRKSAWEKVGGYDTKLPIMGIEDWDFWLTLYEHEIKFHFINEVLFDYRVVADSMLSSLNKSENMTRVLQYLATKHGSGYRDKFVEAAVELNYAKSKPISFFFKYRFPRLYKAWITNKA